MGNMLVELSLEDKLISITGYDASNNETVATELCDSLLGRPEEQVPEPELLYQGMNSYVRCLAHVINLIVRNIPNV